MIARHLCAGRGAEGSDGVRLYTAEGHQGVDAVPHQEWIRPARPPYLQARSFFGFVFVYLFLLFDSLF